MIISRRRILLHLIFLFILISTLRIVNRNISLMTNTSRSAGRWLSKYHSNSSALDNLSHNLSHRLAHMEGRTQQENIQQIGKCITDIKQLLSPIPSNASKQEFNFSQLINDFIQIKDMISAEKKKDGKDSKNATQSKNIFHEDELYHNGKFW